jgi:hypothetical protein
MKELTYLDANADGSRILTLDDPELCRYPIAFMWEPGFWNLTDTEAASFRAYLLKGGFAIFEDFDGPSNGAYSKCRYAACSPKRDSFDSIERTGSSTPSSRSTTSTPSSIRCRTSVPGTTAFSRITIRRAA